MTPTERLRSLFSEPIIFVMKFPGTHTLLKASHHREGGRSIAHIFHDDDADKLQYLFYKLPALLEVVDAAGDYRDSQGRYGLEQAAYMKLDEALANLEKETP